MGEPAVHVSPDMIVKRVSALTTLALQTHVWFPPQMKSFSTVWAAPFAQAMRIAQETGSQGPLAKTGYAPRNSACARPVQIVMDGAWKPMRMHIARELDFPIAKISSGNAPSQMTAQGVKPAVSRDPNATLKRIAREAGHTPPPVMENSA